MENVDGICACDIWFLFENDVDFEPIKILMTGRMSVSESCWCTAYACVNVKSHWYALNITAKVILCGVARI